MKVLVVEDSRGLAERLRTLLSRRYVADVVHTGAEALDQAQVVDYDVIILDLGLPDMQGAVVCKKLRESHITTPVLILSGVNDVETRVQLLDTGADDYVSKPFHGSELLSRVAALARRKANPYAGNLLVVADLEIDVDKRQVRRAGTLIPLRRKEFDILQYLASNQGRAVSREMIMNHAWKSDHETWGTTVDVHIKYLRDKIDRPFKKPLIKTAYGVGYMVEGTL